MKVWKFDDCDFVAAETLAEALAWYLEETGVTPEEITEESLDQTVWTGETPDDPEGERVSFSDYIERVRAAGEAFPQVIAVDGHYA